MPPAIETRGLTKRFGARVAVSDLDLAVEPGEVYGFLGPNGAGKTTTIRMMMGLVRPSRGTARLLGEPVRLGLPPGRVGAMVDVPAFYPYLRGEENLRILTGSTRRERIRQVLDRVGIGEAGRSKVRTYSHGMKQRLGLALALIRGTRVLVLDEPTAGLDPAGRDTFREILRERTRKDGVTVFLSSHLLGEVETICDRIGLLRQGHLVADGRMEDLLKAERWRARIDGEIPESVRREVAGATWCGTPEVDGDSLKVPIDEERAPDLCALLVRAGLRVAEFGPVRPTLEEFFRRHASGGREG
jgi:ABC-2 type transport system ATP-binding protein